jgi:hypothetical protein
LLVNEKAARLAEEESLIYSGWKATASRVLLEAVFVRLGRMCRCLNNRDSKTAGLLHPETVFPTLDFNRRCGEINVSLAC